MKKFYLTFGSDHPLSENWIEIEAKDLLEARALAFDAFGKKWSGMYDEFTWNSGNSANSWTTYFPGGKVGKTLK